MLIDYSPKNAILNEFCYTKVTKRMDLIQAAIGRCKTFTSCPDDFIGFIFGLMPFLPSLELALWGTVLLKVLRKYLNNFWSICYSNFVCDLSS
jgi:hypothetical protein